MMNQGALVLDLSAKDMVIWRGVAQASVEFEADDKKREAILREGVGIYSSVTHRKNSRLPLVQRQRQVEPHPM